MTDEGYDLIGGDGEKYGPASLEELNGFLSQGRVNLQTRVRESGTEDEWVALGEVLGRGSHRESGELGNDILANGRRLRVGQALGGGWSLFTAHTGLLIGASLVYLIIMIGAGAIPFLRVCLMGPLTGGMFILILNLIRTDSADFGDLFAGFERCFGKLLGVGIAQALIIFLAALPGLIMIVAVGFATAAGVDDWERESEAFLGSFLGNPVTIAGFLAMWGLGLTAYIVLYFTVSLAADRSLDFVQTFHVAVRVSMRNFFPILALCLIGGVVIFVSLLPCGLGLIVSVPWRFAVMAHAYEQMFSPDASPNEQ